MLIWRINSFRINWRSLLKQGIAFASPNILSNYFSDSLLKRIIIWILTSTNEPFHYCKRNRRNLKSRTRISKNAQKDFDDLPPGFEPRTLSVLTICDNHYTMEGGRDTFGGYMHFQGGSDTLFRDILGWLKYNMYNKKST